MKRNTIGILIFCALLIIVGVAFNKLNSTKHSLIEPRSAENSSQPVDRNKGKPSPADISTQEIDKLTRQDVVASYVRQNKRLPDYYITKSKARSQGWDARDGNLCSVLPGKAIGGDRFSNREGGLPEASGRVWYEADLNYRCGHRGADRLLYSNDGLIYVSRDHYKRFMEVKS